MIMRAILLMTFLFFVPILVAQEQRPRQTDLEPPSGYPPQLEATTTNAPGHPLDPRDVDILTGKARREVREVRRYPYYYTLSDTDYLDYGAGSFHRWDRRMHTSPRTLSRPFFRSLHPRPFRVIHRPRAFFFLTW